MTEQNPQTVYVFPPGGDIFASDERFLLEYNTSFFVDKISALELSLTPESQKVLSARDPTLLTPELNRSFVS